MKKILIIIIAIGALFTSCEPSSLTSEPLFSDVTWFSSDRLQPDVTTEIPLGRVISAFDLSQGAISHEWSLSTGGAFLNVGFVNQGSRNDVVIADVIPFINEEKGLATSDEKVYILFQSPGDYTITLKNTFSEKVTYMGTIPVESVEDADGNWVFEQVFNITVTDI